MAQTLEETCGQLGIKVADPRSKAISVRDKFHVRYMRGETEWTLESAPTRPRADHAVAILSEHEMRNNRPEIFYAVNL